MNLKKNKEKYMRRIGGSEEDGKLWNYNLKNK